MSNFEQAIEVVLKHEGGYNNVSSDPGGATNYGISLLFLKDHAELDLNQDGRIDLLDIKLMSIDEAKKIYRSYWWDKYGYSEIVDNSVATKIFDLSVNMGASQAHKIVQAALGLSTDGILGPQSRQAINQKEPTEMLCLICDQAAQFYINITKKRVAKYGADEGMKFLLGWIRRAYS